MSRETQANRKQENKIEAFTKVETFKKLQKSSTYFDNIFSKLLENTKTPKYNYHAGLCAGLLLRDFSIMLTLKKDTPKETVETIMDESKTLVETYNWKKTDLYNLLSQVFKE